MYLKLVRQFGRYGLQHILPGVANTFSLSLSLSELPECIPMLSCMVLGVFSALQGCRAFVSDQALVRTPHN